MSIQRVCSRCGEKVEGSYHQMNRNPPQKNTSKVV